MSQILPVPDPVESYWLSQPHEFSNLRSTPDLPSECDITIIGSGMAGIVTAYYVFKESNPPPSVMILEARQLCSGATARNGGHCKMKLPTVTGLVPKIGSEAVNEIQSYVYGIISGLKQLAEEEELDCEFELRRSFDVQLDSRESVSLKEIYEKNRKDGQSWTNNFSWVPAQNVEQVTSIKGALSAASVHACSFWPYKFVTELLARLVARYPEQLNVQTTTPATAITIASNGTNIITTTRGVFKSKKLIFATNAYTAGLLPQFKDVIVPIRGMASHIVPQIPVHPHLSHTYNISFSLDKGVDYLNPRPDGSIVVGGGKWHFQSDRSTWFDNFDDSTRFADEVEKHWEQYMQRNFHGWKDSDAQVDKIWVGIMGVTPDGWSHVGRVPGRDNQWILAGFNGGGMAMILTAAKAVAKMVVKDLGFEDVKDEFGLPAVLATSRERLRQAVTQEMQKRT